MLESYVSRYQRRRKDWEDSSAVMPAGNASAIGVNKPSSRIERNLRALAKPDSRDTVPHESLETVIVD